MKGTVHIFYLAVIVAIFFFFKQCGQSVGLFKTKKVPDTVSVYTVTKEIPVYIDTNYTPEIVGVSNTIYVPKIQWKHDTLTEYEVRIDPADTSAILARFHQKAYYKDVQKIKDYGTVTIEDTVTENRIATRRFTTDLKIPEKTTTITLRDKRTIGYLDVSAIGNPTTPLYSIGGGFSLKLKNDRQYGVGVMYTKDNVLYYYGKFSIPIRLKRKP